MNILVARHQSSSSRSRAIHHYSLEVHISEPKRFDLSCSFSVNAITLVLRIRSFTVFHPGISLVANHQWNKSPPSSSLDASIDDQGKLTYRRDCWQDCQCLDGKDKSFKVDEAPGDYWVIDFIGAFNGTLLYRP